METLIVNQKKYHVSNDFLNCNIYIKDVENLYINPIQFYAFSVYNPNKISFILHYGDKQQVVGGKKHILFVYKKYEKDVEVVYLDVEGGGGEYIDTFNKITLDDNAKQELPLTMTNDILNIGIGTNYKIQNEETTIEIKKDTVNFNTTNLLHNGNVIGGGDGYNLDILKRDLNKIDTISYGVIGDVVDKGENSIAIGVGAGYAKQGVNAVAIGVNAGNDIQSIHAISVGYEAGKTTQGESAVAIGSVSGNVNQGNHSVAVGNATARENQGNYSVAVGNEAGMTRQGGNSVAIGNGAGKTDQATNSIILNGTGEELNCNETGLFIKPLNNKNVDNTKVLSYNDTTGEVFYGEIETGGGGVVLPDKSIDWFNQEDFDKSGNYKFGLDGTWVEKGFENNCINVKVVDEKGYFQVDSFASQDRFAGGLSFFSDDTDFRPKTQGYEVTFSSPIKSIETVWAAFSAISGGEFGRIGKCPVVINSRGEEKGGDDVYSGGPDFSRLELVETFGADFFIGCNKFRFFQADNLSRFLVHSFKCVLEEKAELLNTSDNIVDYLKSRQLSLFIDDNVIKTPTDGTELLNLGFDNVNKNLFLEPKTKDYGEDVVRLHQEIDSLRQEVDGLKTDLLLVKKLLK